MDGADLCFEIEKRALAGFIYSESVASHYMRQILEAIRYCHEQNIIHRDLKPHCILLSSKENSAPIKIGGFSVAIELESQDFLVKSGRIGSPHFMSPEVVKRIEYSKAIDIWSCGTILYILLTGSLPFFGSNEQIFEMILKCNFNKNTRQWQSISDSAKDLLTKMLKLDPKERINIDDALNHPWICDRDKYTCKKHLNDTIDELRKYNARRRLKAAIVQTLSSDNWLFNENDNDNSNDNELLTNSISNILDSLEQMNYLVNYNEFNLEQDIFNDKNFMLLLKVYIVNMFTKVTKIFNFYGFIS
jgi:calcium/calmodulin-dependent serine protein kinase